MTDTTTFFETAAQLLDFDTNTTLSMYTIGESIGMDKEQASDAAQELMGEGLMEVRTLSGGIALTGKGAEKAKSKNRENSDSNSGPALLGDDPVPDENGLRSAEALCAEIKAALPKAGLTYETCAELVTELRCIDLQLLSTRPKTLILKACFQMVAEHLSGSGISPLAQKAIEITGENH